MTKGKMHRMFKLLDEFYDHQHEKDGAPFKSPYAWCRNNRTGALVVYSKHGEQSATLAKKVGVELP